MAGALYTLTEVKEKTGISLPTLQKYKRNYQDRIPSVGEGRTQKYTQESLEVFRQLKKENLKKRGRPRKASKDKAPVKAKAKASAVAPAASSSSNDELLTLKEVSETTGISYPTLSRYTKTSLARIPHVGKGRKRRYRPEAIGVFKTLYEESKRGRRKKGGPSKPSAQGARSVAPAALASGGGGADLGPVIDQLKELLKGQRDLQRQIDKLEKEVNKPFKVTFRRA